MVTVPFHLCLEIKSDFGYLPFLTQIFKILKTPKAPQLTQILVEAYNNAVLHAHKRNKKKWITIDILMTPKQARIQVIDRGKGMKALRSAKPTSLYNTHGRGMELIHAFADKIISRRKNDHHIFEAKCFL